ncbi:hypothetical protein VCHENC02_2287B, partial [Vibrio harveyi]
VLLD